MAVYSYAGSNFFNRSIRDGSFKMDKMHIHTKHELYFLEEGGTKYFVGNEIYILKPGDILFVPKDVFHMTDKYECEAYKRILLVFDDDFVGEEYMRYIDMLKENKFFRVPPTKLYRFYDIFAKLEHETKHKSKEYQELFKLYLSKDIMGDGVEDRVLQPLCNDDRRQGAKSLFTPWRFWGIWSPPALLSFFWDG